MISNSIPFIQVWTGAYYSFLIVRHPFDRVLSAYRDRIANKETGQAQHHIPRIYVALKVWNKFILIINVWNMLFSLKYEVIFNYNVQYFSTWLGPKSWFWYCNAVWSQHGTSKIYSNIWRISIVHIDGSSRKLQWWSTLAAVQVRKIFWECYLEYS